MVGLDTNVLVRYLAQDERRQAARATRLIEEELSVAAPGFVSQIVLVELCWVLQRLYAASAEELRETVVDLLAMPQLHMEQRDAVQAVLRRIRKGAGAKAPLVDALIAQSAIAAGCEKTWSFDRRACKSAGMTLLA